MCTGKPAGYLLTKKNDYENYVLTLEWRWPEKGGNNGVLVHVTTPGALGVWPKCLEVQLGSGNAGDFWVIGTTLDMPNIENRREDRRHLNLTDDSEKPLGEWNEMEVTCRGDELIREGQRHTRQSRNEAQPDPRVRSLCNRKARRLSFARLS